MNPPAAGNDPHPPTTETKAITMTRYVALVAIEDDSFCFTIPDLPGFTAQFDPDEADDLDHAITLAEDVLADFTGAMLDKGTELPTPRSMGAIEINTIWQNRRGEDGFFVLLNARPRAAAPKRVNISMDSTTLARIDENAKARGLTRSAYLAEAALEYG